MFRLKAFLRRSLISTLAAFCHGKDLTFDFLKKHGMKLVILFILASIVNINTYILRRTGEYRSYRSLDKVVQIENGGTGFRFEWKGKTYIGTAAHVCRALQVHKRDVTVSDTMTKTKQVEQILIMHNTIDVCVLTDSTGGPAFELIEQDLGFAAEVYTFGYSSMVGLTYGKGETGIAQYTTWQSDLLNQAETLECFVHGKIPGYDVMMNPYCPYDARFQASNIEVYPGQSGSALITSDHKLAGVLSMTVPNGSLWVPATAFRSVLEKGIK